MTTVALLGCDGSLWSLLSRESPARLAAGLGGLHLPTVRHRWATTARSSGSRWKGSVTSSRSFTMNVVVGDAEPPYRTGDSWRRLDGLFWKALSTDAPATLVVNGRRRLTFRLDEDQDVEFLKDPALMGKAVYPISCIADQPEWIGEEQEAIYFPAAAPTQNYYGGSAGVGPPFVIDISPLTRTGRISNPGDLPSHPVWTITGPAVSVEVGIPGRTVRLPFALLAGDVVVIDTKAQTITDPTGNNLWPKMGSTPVDFAPIPPGDSVEIAIGVDQPQAATSVKIELITRYLRAWGGEPVDTPAVSVGSYPGPEIYPSMSLYPAA